MSILRKIMRNMCKRAIKSNEIKEVWHNLDHEAKTQLRDGIIKNMHYAKTKANT